MAEISDSNVIPIGRAKRNVERLDKPRRADVLRLRSGWGIDASPDRPKTRADCAQVERPCPWISCRMNLFLDVLTSGSILFNHPGKEPHEVPATGSCALDIAERGPSTHAEIGKHLNIVRQRSQQIEDKAIRKLAAMKDGAVFEGLRPDPVRYHLPIVPSELPATSGDAKALKAELDRKFGRKHGWRDTNHGLFVRRKPTGQAERVLDYVRAHGAVDSHTALLASGSANRKGYSLLTGMVRRGLLARVKRGHYVVAKPGIVSRQPGESGMWASSENVLEFVKTHGTIGVTDTVRVTGARNRREAANLLYRLAHTGKLVRVTRGIYTAPETIATADAAIAVILEEMPETAHAPPTFPNYATGYPMPGEPSAPEPPVSEAKPETIAADLIKEAEDHEARAATLRAAAGALQKTEAA